MASKNTDAARTITSLSGVNAYAYMGEKTNGEQGRSSSLGAIANRQEALKKLLRLAGGDMLHTSGESETA